MTAEGRIDTAHAELTLGRSPHGRLVLMAWCHVCQGQFVDREVRERRTLVQLAAEVEQAWNDRHECKVWR